MQVRAIPQAFGAGFRVQGLPAIRCRAQGSPTMRNWGFLSRARSHALYISLSRYLSLCISFCVCVCAQTWWSLPYALRFAWLVCSVAFAFSSVDTLWRRGRGQARGSSEYRPSKGGGFSVVSPSNWLVCSVTFAFSSVDTLWRQGGGCR